MIGFIGLGLMGSRMAGRLQGHGNDMIVHNRTKAKAGVLLKSGAAWAESPAEVAVKADVLFTMLADPAAVEKTALGGNGFLPRLKEGTLWVDCSTVNPSFTRRMAKEASERNIRFLDAPVAGTTGPAEKGELLFLVGGLQKDLEEVEPLLKQMGKAIKYVGENGHGTSLKMVVNMMLAQSMAAFSEAMALGVSLGLEKKTVMDALIGGPVAAPFLAGKKAKILEESYDEVEFPLKWIVKDLHLAMLSAYEGQTALPMVSAAKEIYTLAVQNGFAEKDFSAVCRFLAERTD